MWLLKRRRRPLGPCVICSHKLNAKGDVAAMKEDAVRKICGGLPSERSVYIDPEGNQRWFAHLTCMRSAALRAAGELDTTCVVCGQDVDAEERKPARDDEVRNLLGVKKTKPGKKRSFEDLLLTSFEAVRCAWQCDRCARWQCNRCVCAALTSGGSSISIPDHADCGGQFAPPS